MSQPESDPRNATLIARRDLDRSHTVFTVRPDAPISFAAGQWTELGLPKAEHGKSRPSGDEFVKDGVVRRSYSICSCPGCDELEFYYNRVEEGQLTRWLWELTSGDRLYVDPEARGHFTVDITPHGSDILFVSTGTGVAPFVSMIRYFAAYPDKIPWNSLTLIHGTRHHALLAFEDELRPIADDPTNKLTYIPTLTREPADSDWQGKRERVTGLVRDFVRNSTSSSPQTLDISKLHAYLCGNATMIAAVEGELMPLGLIPRWQDPAGTIHTEVYY